ncbi:MAG: PEP-utilizing enzyme [Candidatus Nanoarchaeia archaeon]|nr:PEP-utilizing enzyme [Candidatus Nanoarchaeia archaeon]
MNIKQIRETIEKYGLKPSSKRDIPLFTINCASFSYFKPLRQKVGFCYDAFAAIGGNEDMQMMINEKYIADETEKLIEKGTINKIMDPAEEIFTYCKSQIEKINVKDWQKTLRTIVEVYPMVLLGLGLYNCFHRCLNGKEDKEKLSSELVENISKKRDNIAKLYRILEKLFKQATDLAGKENGIDGDLIRYLTLDEMRSYSKKFIISNEKIKELSQRRDGYFYIRVGDKEIITTKKNLINQIYKEFFEVDKNTNELKGYPVYKGKVKGEVCNLDKHEYDKVKEGSILVINMTNPGDIDLIKKCSAIVTNEGGILSHAAVISRELKKPCVVGTKIATKVFKDGDLVEVDANKGIVRKIKN